MPALPTSDIPSARILIIVDLSYSESHDLPAAPMLVELPAHPPFQEHCCSSSFFPLSFCGTRSSLIAAAAAAFDFAAAFAKADGAAPGSCCCCAQRC